MAKRRLGRGLDALIPQKQATEDRGGPSDEGVNRVAVDRISPNPFQPRSEFDSESLEELASSIKEHGVVQPIIVKPVGEDYQLVAGERRWRACKLAGLSTIPAIVRDFSEAEMMEIALVENLQREDLNPMEEAVAYNEVINRIGLTQQELADRIGKSRSQVANTLRLLRLAAGVRQMLASDKITMGHAKALLGIEDPEYQQSLAAEVVKRGLNVRQTEKLIQRVTQRPEDQAGKGVKPSPGEADGQEWADTPDAQAVVDELREALGTQIKIKGGYDKGRIEIDYYGREDLERIVDAILK